MADHVDESWLDDQPVMPVGGLLRKMRSADLLFFCGDDVISRSIQRITGSPWSHTALVVRSVEWQRDFVMECVPRQGVRLAPLLPVLEKTDGEKILLARCSLVTNKTVRLAVVQAGLSRLTTPYSISDIFRLWWQIRSLWWKLRQVAMASTDDQYVCSEYVADCLKDGVGLDVPTEWSEPTPEDLWRVEQIVPVARIK